MLEDRQAESVYPCLMAFQKKKEKQVQRRMVDMTWFEGQ